MAVAMIALTDEDGSIRLDAEFVMADGQQGFDRSSPAHQHAALLRKTMDTLAKRLPDVVSDPTDAQLEAALGPCGK